MYTDYYRMQVEPFPAQPIPDAFFDSKTHREAWYYLMYGLKSKDPILLIVGDWGMGKTKICLKLMQYMREKKKIPFVHISNSAYTYFDILLKISNLLKIDTNGSTIYHVQESVSKFFESTNNINEMYIIIDDVTEMDISTISKLKIFINPNMDGTTPVRMILFAHTSFIDSLKKFELQPLSQRIRRVYSLVPFSPSELKEYIYFSLYKSGAPGKPGFTEGAIERIYGYTRGVPRLINSLCDVCLSLGAMWNIQFIDEKIVNQAIVIRDNGRVNSDYESLSSTGIDGGSSSFPSFPLREKPRQPMEGIIRSTGVLATRTDPTDLRSGPEAESHNRLRLVILFALAVIIAIFVLGYIGFDTLFQRFFGSGGI